MCLRRLPTWKQWTRGISGKKGSKNTKTYWENKRRPKRQRNKKRNASGWSRTWGKSSDSRRRWKERGNLKLKKSLKSSSSNGKVRTRKVVLKQVKLCILLLDQEGKSYHNSSNSSQNLRDSHISSRAPNHDLHLRKFKSHCAEISHICSLINKFRGQWMTLMISSRILAASKIISVHLQSISLSFVGI